MDWKSLIEGIETEHDWPEGASCLRNMEKTLRCPICHATMRAPVLLSKCGHSFCSYCIRQSLGFSQNCPLCKKEATESDLIKNITVLEITDLFKECRNDLLELAKQLFAPRVSKKRSSMLVNISSSDQSLPKRLSSTTIQKPHQKEESSANTDKDKALEDKSLSNASESSFSAKSSEQESDSAFEQEYDLRRRHWIMIRENGQDNSDCEIEDVLSESSDLDDVTNVESDSDSLMCECPICGDFFSSGIIEVQLIQSILICVETCKQLRWNKSSLQFYQAFETFCRIWP